MRCVTPAPSITLVRSRSIGPVPRWSNKLTPPPEQDGHQVDVDLVEESRSDALLHDARSAHADVLVAGNRVGLREGAWRPSVTKVNGDPSQTHSGGTELLTTKTGTSKDVCHPTHG